MTLTTKRIAKLTEGRHRDPETRRLYLQVGPTGKKSWLLRYELNHRERFMGLGSLDDFTLREARERARRARQLIADGVDPIDTRRAAKAAKALEAARAMTFADAAKNYYEAHEATWTNARHRQQFRHTMRDYVLPKIGRLAVADVDVGRVLACVEPHWQAKPATMSRVLRRIAAVLDWATVRGYRTGDNPARWRGHLSEALPAPQKVAKVEHHPAMPYAELPQFMSELRTVPGVAARALEFLILTASRTGEVANAVWSEIDLDARVWIIPAERMKSDREHRVALSDRAVEILRALPREAEFVFVSPVHPGRPIAANTAMWKVLRRLRSDVNVHGFRATFSTWAHETTAFSNHAIELSLAHVVGSETERAYRRATMFDKRRQLMDSWSRYCSTPAAPGEVVPIGARR
jgi:integrase